MSIANLPMRTAALTGLVICGALLTLVTTLRADGPEQPNDRAILLADIFDPPPILPNNALDAVETFDRRASKILRYAACRPEEPNNGYIGVFNTNFGWNPGATGGTGFFGLESWGRDALAKLAYTGDCPTTTAADRYRKVDAALSQISIPSDLQLGTTVDRTSYAGFTFERHGELDTGLKELIPIVYMYKEKIPVSYGHLLTVLTQAVARNGPIIGSPPVFIMDIGDIGHATLPETENHTLLELSEQYLVNQLFNRESANTCSNLQPGKTAPICLVVAFDNSQVHDYLMRLLRGILTSDFFEYNSKPYQHYALYAMENLADFAADADVATAAQMVLDFTAAKFAISSSLVRRSSPYRRRGSHDGNLFTGSEADEQLCRFYLFSGQLQAIYKNDAYSAGSGCISAVRDAVGTYHIPYAILEIAITKSVPYFQTISGGPSYYGSMFGHDANGGAPVPGPTEVYDNEESFLIAAGGTGDHGVSRGQRHHGARRRGGAHRGAGQRRRGHGLHVVGQRR